MTILHLFHFAATLKLQITKCPAKVESAGVFIGFSINIFSWKKSLFASVMFPAAPKAVQREVSLECDGYSAAMSCCRVGQVSACLEYVG